MTTTEKTEDPNQSLPSGFLDRYGEELRKQRIVETLFRAEGFKRGYFELETPILENVSSIPRELFSCWPEENFITFELPDYESNHDPHHLKKVGTRKVVLRPEGTLPVCRWLAGNIASGNQIQLPVKILYDITNYRNEPINEVDHHKRREFKQLGVEYIGSSDLSADSEVMGYAYDLMLAVGLKRDDIRFRVSNVRLFNDLCADSSFDDNVKHSLQERIDHFSKQRSLGLESHLGLSELARLGPELFKRWNTLLETYTTSLPQVRVIDKDLYDLVGDLNSKNVPVVSDLSVVRGYSYYTGPVFQIDVRDQSGRWISEIAGGGRYDDTIGQYLAHFNVKQNVPATGFAFGTERLTRAANMPSGVYPVNLVL